MGVVNQSELEWDRTEKSEVTFKRKQLSKETPGEGIGCSLYELPPGKKSWPYHYHAGNEEAVYVLEGRGMMRLGDDKVELEAGDYVALPPEADHAHRIINDSDEPLRYLAMSTMRDPDVVVYPDSDKVGVFTGSAPGGHEDREMTKYFPGEADVSYWEGEC